MHSTQGSAKFKRVSAFMLFFPLSLLSSDVPFGDVRERKTGVITYFAELAPIGYPGARFPCGDYNHL
ncbi:hypothetical protein LEMLEM_LOCUS5072 [Lemmus lemmus]